MDDLPPTYDPDRRYAIDEVVLEKQKADQWCWLACASSVAKAMNLSQQDGRYWNQCAILKAHDQKLDVSALCSHAPNRLDGLCNIRDCHSKHWREKTGSVMDALQSVLQIQGFERFQLSRDEDNTPQLHADVRAMVRRNIPVPVLTLPPGAKVNHYVLIVGYDTNASQYLIWDPATTRGGLRWVSLTRWDEVGSWIGVVQVEAVATA